MALPICVICLLKRSGWELMGVQRRILLFRSATQPWLMRAYAILKPGRRYRITMYLVYRREYFGFTGDYYVYVAGWR